MTRCPNAEDGKPSIYTALSESAEAIRRDSGVDYNFSAIRLKDTKVKGTASSAIRSALFQSSRHRPRRSEKRNKMV
jgi:hypothetical protein